MTIIGLTGPMGAGQGTVADYYKENGYEIKDFTIKKGQTVVFKNLTADGNFWPASNIHPTHQIYPEFDPKEPIPPAGECTTNKDCGDETGCTAICDNNKCLNTGRYLCPNKKACVTSQAHCDCQNENGGSGCKPCIESCRIGSGVCIKTGKIVCPTGE